MPSAKSHHNTLPSGLCFFLAHGRTADVDEGGVPHGFRAGNFESFMLWGRVLHLRRADVCPSVLTVLDELGDLWREHEAEIRAAAGDAEPWVETFLKRGHTDTDEEEP